MLLYWGIFTLGFYIGVMMALRVSQEKEDKKGQNPAISIDIQKQQSSNNYINALVLKLGNKNSRKLTPVRSATSSASRKILTPLRLTPSS